MNSKRNHISVSAMIRLPLIVGGMIIAIISILLPGRASAAGSHLDYSFGDKGRTNFSFGGLNINDPAAVAVQPDGKIVVVGETDLNGDRDFAIARLNPNGTLDTTFDGDGRLTIGFGVQTEDQASAVLIQPDGKIVVVGETRSSTLPGRFAILRLTDQGIPDLTFDGDGRLVVDFGTGYSSANAVAIQPDGKLIIVGSTTSGGSSGRPEGGVTSLWAMLRISTAGVPDNTFGNQGRVMTSFSTGTNEGQSVVVLPNGKIMVVGRVSTTTGDDIGLVRYTEQGAPDAALNGNGKVLIDIDGGDDDPSVIKLTPDGKLVIGGTSNILNGDEIAIAIVRCSIDGVLDPTFGNTGKVLTKFNPDNFTTRLAGLAINGSGEIVVAGSISADSVNSAFNVIKYQPNGQLDSRFGSGGRVGTVFGPGLREASGVTFQSDGKIVAIGRVRDYHEFGVARYTPRSIAAESDYDGDGRAEIGVFRGSDGIWYIQNLVTGAKSYIRFGIGGDLPVPGDYDGDGKTDVAVFRPANATWYINRSSDGRLMVAPFGLSTDTPVPGDYDGDGKTDIAVYRMSTGTWYLQQSFAGIQTIKYGSDFGFPVVGDYDGDGQTDLAVYRPIDRTWWVRGSALPIDVREFGSAGDIPVQADYDGDGVTDLAIFRNDGNWWVRRSENNSVRADHWGVASDVTTPADFDGDGKSNLAVFRSFTGVWYVMRGDGTIQILEWGIAGDMALPGINHSGLR